MPWRECSVMDERVRFIGCLLDGEGMSELCREFGISRKTGYKIFNRYRQDGVEALTQGNTSQTRSGRHGLAVSSSAAVQTSVIPSLNPFEKPKARSVVLKTPKPNTPNPTGTIDLVAISSFNFIVGN